MPLELADEVVQAGKAGVQRDFRQVPVCRGDLVAGRLDAVVVEVIHRCAVGGGPEEADGRL